MESKASEVTSSSSLKSRKRQEKDSIETPPSKKTKPEEDETSGPDFSKLPVEVLEIICKYVDKESRKALGETCKVLFLLSVPQVLRMDFDRIQNESGNFPIINRAHQALRLVGEKVRGTKVQFNKALQSSRSSAKAISIGEINFGRHSEDEEAPDVCWDSGDILRYGTLISFSRIQYLLEHFPNLTTVEVRGVYTKVGREIKPLELPKLKILHLEYIKSDVVAAFGQLKTLEELDIKNFRPAETAVIQKLIYAQKGLKTLKLRSFRPSDDDNFDFPIAGDEGHSPLLKLREMTSEYLFHYFELAPNLEHLRLDFHPFCIENFWAQDFLMSCRCETLKTLFINGTPGSACFTNLQLNYPMIEN